jgi:hypothetical protein
VEAHYWHAADDPIVQTKVRFRDVGGAGSNPATPTKSLTNLIIISNVSTPLESRRGTFMLARAMIVKASRRDD